MVETTDAAEARLGSGQPVDVIISDIWRGDGQDVGLSDLERWRKDELYAGPVVFYTSRVTPLRRETARALGATVTNDPRELMKQIRVHAPRTLLENVPFPYGPAE